MKVKEKNKARKLRKEKGWSINQISEELNVAKSSVSLWVRNIQLSPEQESVLLAKNPRYNNQIRGGQTRSQDAKNKRQEYQEIGKQEARKKDLLHAKGCMLFWAEGNKTKNSIIFSNSDPDMMILFVKFLCESIQVLLKEMRLSINCYLGNGLSVRQVENYWLNILDLPRSCLTKTMINRASKYSKKLKKNKLIYGVCRVSVHNTEKAQMLFGAIKEYAGIENNNWLF